MEGMKRQARRDYYCKKCKYGIVVAEESSCNELRMCKECGIPMEIIDFKGEIEV